MLSVTRIRNELSIMRVNKSASMSPREPLPGGEKVDVGRCADATRSPGGTPLWRAAQLAGSGDRGNFFVLVDLFSVVINNTA